MSQALSSKGLYLSYNLFLADSYLNDTHKYLNTKIKNAQIIKNSPPLFQGGGEFLFGIEKVSTPVCVLYLSL